MTKWLTSAILDVRISLSIAFLVISDRYATLIILKFLTKKWLTSAILDVRNSLSIAFLAISDQYATFFFGNFWQNGCRWPFWMSEIHFRSHFWPFQINRPFWISEIHFRSQFWSFQIDTEFYFCPAAILDVWKLLWITFLAISDWSVILDVRNSLSMAFLAISDPYRTFFLIFDKMAGGGHFGCLQIAFDRISGHFKSIRNFFLKMFW